ncbi:unnamed protein product, partial [Onchocerca flexuosa]|uniref:Tetratricopeptide repeat protein 5 n=1 Tax=Onchocerca flexuosa TaxID=387005 RepID=A0A183H4G8_9BILA
MELSAKEHLERCLTEEHDYAIGKAHCRLASLYPDFDLLLCDVRKILSKTPFVNMQEKKNRFISGSQNESVSKKDQEETCSLMLLDQLEYCKIMWNQITELRFYMKWSRAIEAVPVLERLVKTHPSDEAWTLIHQLFLRASSSENSTEKVLFTEISNDAFEFIIGGLTKRFDNDDLLKTKLLLFCLRNADENKFNKLLNRAVTFITERASNDKELKSGIGKYHVYLAVFVAPALLKLNFTNIAVSRALSIVITVLHVGIAWPEHNGAWTNLLRAVSENYAADAHYFSQESFKIGAALFDKCVILYDLGAPVNLSSNVSGCSVLSGLMDKTYCLKSEARKIVFPFFMWYAYKQWKANISE